MILYNQLSVFASPQSPTHTPSWMRIDNFGDFVLRSRSNTLFERLLALLRR